MKRHTHLILLLVALLSGAAFANHPVPGAGEEAPHPALPVPAGAAVPHVSARLEADANDGYNLLLTTTAFGLRAPLANAPDQIDGVLQGHAHLYINGKKIMRLYGNAVHVPARLLHEGVNSISVSLNDHHHRTFTWQGQDIQATLLIDTRASAVVKSSFVWPASQ